MIDTASTITKAAEGAWIIILMIPTLVAIFEVTRRHYDQVASELTLRDWTPAPEGQHVVIVPIGGGGLISGVANYIKAVRPEIKVIGVQMDDSSAMMQSVQKGKRVQLHDVGLFSDGTAVKWVGEETFRISRTLVDDYITVVTDAVCAAIKDVFVDTRSIVEPAGALAVAAIKQYSAKHKTKGHLVRMRPRAKVVQGGHD